MDKKIISKKQFRKFSIPYSIITVAIATAIFLGESNSKHIYLFLIGLVHFIVFCVIINYFEIKK